MPYCSHYIGDPSKPRRSQGQQRFGDIQEDKGYHRSAVGKTAEYA